MKKKIKIKGFLIKKKFLNKSELNKFERNLINFIYKFCIKSHKIISNRAKFVLSLNGNKFRLAAIKLLELIEKKDKDLFYKISKNCADFFSIDRIDNNKKMQQILKDFFGTNFDTIQRRQPIMLFNKKNLDRLKYSWHQESQFYPDHKIGLHVWFPIFRDVKGKSDGGMVFAVNGYKKNYKFTLVNSKNSWTQKIPNINVEKNFKSFSPNVKRGDAIFFTGPQLHKSDDQFNPVPRVSFVIRYLSNSKNINYHPLP